MRRRNRSAFDEVHMIQACRTTNQPRAYQTYARWLRAKGRWREAEEQETRAKWCDRIDFHERYETLRAIGDVKLVAGGRVVVVESHGWKLWCDAEQLQHWLKTSLPTPDEDLFSVLPGELTGPPEALLVSLWDEGAEVSPSLRRVRGECDWYVERFSEIVTGDVVYGWLHVPKT